MLLALSTIIVSVAMVYFVVHFIIKILVGDL